MIRGRIVAMAVCALVGSTGLMAVPQPAAARSTATVNSPGAALNVRTGPARWYPRVARLTHGATIEPVCQVEGEYVAGTERDTNLWDRLPGGTYVHDGHVRRSGSLPRCGGTASAPHLEWTRAPPR